jgi:hypothetical protein
MLSKRERKRVPLRRREADRAEESSFRDPDIVQRRQQVIDDLFPIDES